MMKQVWSFHVDSHAKSSLTNMKVLKTILLGPIMSVFFSGMEEFKRKLSYQNWHFRS